MLNEEKVQTFSENVSNIFKGPEKSKKSKIMLKRPVVVIRHDGKGGGGLPCMFCGEDSYQSELIGIYDEKGEPLCDECISIYAPELGELVKYFFCGSAMRDMRLRDEIVNIMLSFDELASAFRNMDRRNQYRFNGQIYKLLRKRTCDNNISV